MPNTASADAAVSPPTASFRLLSTVALFLPNSAGARLDRDRVATPRGRYWVTSWFATVNRSFDGGLNRSFEGRNLVIGPGAAEL